MAEALAAAPKLPGPRSLVELRPVHSVEFPAGPRHRDVVDLGFLQNGSVVAPVAAVSPCAFRGASSTVTMSNSSPFDWWMVVTRRPSSPAAGRPETRPASSFATAAPESGGGSRLRQRRWPCTALTRSPPPQADPDSGMSPRPIPRRVPRRSWRTATSSSSRRPEAAEQRADPGGRERCLVAGPQADRRGPPFDLLAEKVS